MISYAQKENIGFQYVLEALQPCSPYGQSLLRELRPYTRSQLPELRRQLDNIQRVLTGWEECLQIRKSLLRCFMALRMLLPTAKKCLEGPLNDIELFELKRFLLQTHELLPLWREMQSVLRLQGITLSDTEAALNILDPRKDRVAAFHIADEASPALLALRQEKRTLEAQLRLDPGNGELLSQRSRVAAREEQEEIRLRFLLSEALRPHIPAILANMAAMGELDFTLEKARLARRYGGVLPELTEDRLAMEAMVNPRIADLLEAQGKTFVPVSIALETGATVITGANMGGKSVALKTLALNVLLVHCGFFPFAKAAQTPIFRHIHLLSEDLSSIDRGLSSFGGEMVGFHQVMWQLSEGYSLVLLDEFARGTNPDEGTAIAQAVTEYLNGQNAISVLATHYDHVAPLARAHYQVVGLRELDVEALRSQIAQLGQAQGMELIARHMNYGLYRVEGTQDCPRDALNICRLLGIPEIIMKTIEKYYDNSGKFC